MNPTVIGHFSGGRSGRRRARVLTVAAVAAALLTGACGTDVDAEGVTGAITPVGGAPQHFTAEPSEDDAGLFLAGGNAAVGAYNAGWVVLADGSQTGTVSVKGERSAAPKIKVKKKKRRHGHDEPSQVAPGEPAPGGQVTLPGGGVEPVDPPAEIADPPGSGPVRAPVEDEPPIEIADPPASGPGRVPVEALATAPAGGQELVRTVTELRGNGVGESEADLPGIGPVEPERIDPEDVRVTVEIVAESAHIKSAPPIRT